MSVSCFSRSLALGLASAALIAGCVFGFRGQVPFSDEADLSGLDTVSLDLPATSLVVVGDASRSFIDWSGSWTTLGGSSQDALSQARKAALVWETWGSIGRLSASVPLETRDITSLDALEVESASYLAHEIVGSGDVFVSNIDAYVSVELDGGNVEIIGGAETLAVATARGSIELTTSAAVSATSGFGEVRVELEAARDVEIETLGAVTVALADASSLDIDIDDAGQIRVELDGVAHLGAGSYRRSVGPAANRLWIRAGGGPVTLRASAADPDGGGDEPEP